MKITEQATLRKYPISSTFSECLLQIVMKEAACIYIYSSSTNMKKKTTKYKQLLNTGSSRKTKLLMLPKNYLQFLRNNYISLLFYHNHKMNTNYNTKSWKIDFYTYVNLRVYRTNITIWQVVKFKRFYIASLAKQI